MHFETTKAGKFSDMNHIPGKWEVFMDNPTLKYVLKKEGRGGKQTNQRYTLSKSMKVTFL